MKEEILRHIFRNSGGIPSVFKKYIRYAIIGIVGLFISGILLTGVLVYVLIRYLGGPITQTASEVRQQSGQIFQEGRQTIEERLQVDEDKIKELEMRINELENTSN